MKKLKQIIHAVTILIALGLPLCNFGQSTSGNNNPGFGKFLGYNGGQNLEFRTNNITRMQLMQNGAINVDGYNINNSGFLGLSIDPVFFSQNRPFSLLHLNGELNDGSVGAQIWGYRDWMRPGIKAVIKTHFGNLIG